MLVRVAWALEPPTEHLIKCEEKIVMEYRVRKECPNKGRIFYKCPDRNVSYFVAFDDYG